MVAPALFKEFVQENLNVTALSVDVYGFTGQQRRSEDAVVEGLLQPVHDGSIGACLELRHPSRFRGGFIRNVLIHGTILHDNQRMIHGPGLCRSTQHGGGRTLANRAVAVYDFSRGSGTT